MIVQAILFYIFAVVAVASGVLVVLALAVWKAPVPRSWAWLLDGKPDEDASDPAEES